VDYNEEN